MIKIYTGALLLFFMQSVFAAASPVDELNNVAQQIIKQLKAHQSELKSNPRVIHYTVEKYLLPHVDLTGMSRSVLGREVWKKASAQERSAFIRAFTQLVIRTYSTPLAKYHGETIRFHPIRGGVNGRFVRVESEVIRPSGPPIPLDYNLVMVNGEWKIYDLSVEGVSLLQSYRSQFEEALSHGSLPELTAKLQKGA